MASASSVALATLLKVAGCSAADEFEAAFAPRLAEELCSALEQVGVAAEVVRPNQPEAFLDRAEHRATQLVVAHPHKEYGTFEEAGRLWDFGDLPHRLDRTAPTLGEHTAEILRELDLVEQIERLASLGVVAGPGVERSE